MHTHHDGSAAGLATDATAAPSAREWWEARYAERDGIWSGRVNAVLASVTWGLPVGRALDLGCGEGGDVVWLAEQGWDVTGIDLSVTALPSPPGCRTGRRSSPRTSAGGTPPRGSTW